MHVCEYCGYLAFSWRAIARHLRIEHYVGAYGEIVLKNGSEILFVPDVRANAGVHGIQDKRWSSPEPPELIDCKLSCVDFLEAYNGTD